MEQCARDNFGHMCCNGTVGIAKLCDVGNFGLAASLSRCCLSPKKDCIDRIDKQKCQPFKQEWQCFVAVSNKDSQNIVNFSTLFLR